MRASQPWLPIALLLALSVCAALGASLGATEDRQIVLIKSIPESIRIASLTSVDTSDRSHVVENDAKKIDRSFPTLNAASKAARKPTLTSLVPCVLFSVFSHLSAPLCASSLRLSAC